MWKQYELWMKEWPVVYVILGLAVFGVLCKMFADIGMAKMAGQVKRLQNGKKIRRKDILKLVRRFKKHRKEQSTAERLERNVEETAARAKVMGVAIYPLENWNLVMIVACFLLGMLSSLHAFLSGADDREIVFLFVTGLFGTGIGVLAELLFATEYYRMLFVLGMENYLEGSMPGAVYETEKVQDLKANVEKVQRTETEDRKTKRRKLQSVPVSEKTMQKEEKQIWENLQQKNPEEMRKEQREQKLEPKPETNKKAHEESADQSELLEEILRSLLVE